jgi:hypothetical protein
MQFIVDSFSDSFVSSLVRSTNGLFCLWLRGFSRVFLSGEVIDSEE